MSYPCKLGIKSILSTLRIKCKEDFEQEAYRLYSANCLRMIAFNTARLSQGEYITKNLADIINPKPEDNRTGAEIVEDVINKLGLEVIKT